MQNIILTVSSDLVGDQRVHKMALTLSEMGNEVKVIGRKKRNSLPYSCSSYRFRRLNLIFEKGVLFYSALQIRLFFYLLFSKVDIIWSNDLDTLLPCFFIAKLRRKKLVYDSHEYFTGVPELQNKQLVRGIWKSIEAYIFPRLENIITVNHSVAKLYESEYGKKLNVIYNYPFYYKKLEPIEDHFTLLPASHSEKAIVINFTFSLLLQEKRKIIIYQGAVNKDRGLDEAIDAMEWVENAILLIIGSGDEFNKIRIKVEKSTFSHKICVLGAIPFQYLKYFTSIASLGLSIEKPNSINYQLASPNKVFDYIAAKVPVLGSHLPEIEEVILKYDLGTFIESHQPQHIAEKINFLLRNEDLLSEMKKNCQKAKEKLHWESQKPILEKVLKNM